MESDPGQGSPLEHWSDIVQLFLAQITAILIYSISYVCMWDVLNVILDGWE